MSIRVSFSQSFRSLILATISIATLIAAIILAGPQPAAAQSRVIQKWSAQVNGPAQGQDGVNAITADSDANVYAAGYVCVTASSPGNCTRTDLQIEKYNSRGRRLWGGSLQSGGNWAEAKAIAVDSAGNVYVTGWGETGQHDSIGIQTVTFITIKYSREGSRQWIRYYQDSPDDINGRGPAAIALDKQGNAYVTGYISADINSSFDGPISVLKYSPSGALLWVSTFDYSQVNPGSGYTRNAPTGLAVDPSGNAVVTGYSGNYDQSTGNESLLGVTVKYDASGSRLWYEVATVSGFSQSINNAVVLDSAGNACVGGEGLTPDGPNGSVASGYAIKYRSDGTQAWIGQVPSSNSSVFGIALGPNGNVYVIGDYISGAENPQLPYATTKFDSAGNAVWEKFYSGEGDVTDGASALFVNAEDDVYVTGGGTAANDSTQLETIKYDGAGNQLWVARISNGTNQGTALMAASNGNLYVAGNSNTSGQRGWLIVDYVQDAADATPTSLTFPSQKVGTTSPAQTVTLKNTYSGDLTINNIEASGPFSEASDCPSVLAGGATCTIQVKFTPTETGTQTGSLSIYDPWAGSPNVVSLSGTGTN